MRVTFPTTGHTDVTSVQRNSTELATDKRSGGEGPWSRGDDLGQVGTGLTPRKP